MSKLQLLLLGHFECLLPSGKRVSLTMRKAEVLLAFLALAPGMRHPRERLINLLWSNRSEEQARNSLRQCLSTLRKALGDSADLALQIDRSTVCLKPEMEPIRFLSQQYPGVPPTGFFQTVEGQSRKPAQKPDENSGVYSKQGG